MASAGSDGGRGLRALEAVAIGAVAITARALIDSGQELTFAQWRVLVIVGASPDGLTVSEIATRIGAEISPASRLVRRLAARGSLATEKDPDDRRATRVTITDAGQVVRETVLERRRAYLADVVTVAGPLPPDLVRSLERIASAFGPYT